MFSLKKQQKGFTIVELLIVIVVIGILATLVIVTFTGIQKKARDSKRQTDVQAVSAQLAAFYTQNAYYPTIKDLQTATWVSANMKGLDPAALVDPKGGTITGNAPAANVFNYTYVASSSTGGTCTATSPSDPATNNGCDTYTLTAELEAGGTYAKASN